MKLYDVIRKEQLEHGVDLEHEVPEPKPEHRYTPPKKRFSFRKIFIIGLALILLVGLYIFGMKVVQAKVVVAERKIPFTLNKANIELVHEKNADAGRLSFQAMVVTTEITREVYGSEAKASTSKATGSAVFFNEYSKSKQTIKSGTTLIGANGKRYVTQAQVVIPGFTTQGREKKAGTSPAVKIIAADVGTSFNSEGTTFTISGYSGTKAKQLYARSTGAISGGETGALHAVSEEDREDVMESLRAQLTERLKRETRAQIPENLITFPDLQFVTIDTDAVVLQGSSIKFPAKIKGSMISYLIPRDLLEASIAKRAVGNQEYLHVSIPTISDLEIEPVTAIPASAEDIPEVITISVSGSGKVITKVPVEHVKEYLVGKPRKQFSNALSEIPEIDTARYKLFPFWSPFFPKETDDIKVEVE